MRLVNTLAASIRLTSASCSVGGERGSVMNWYKEGVTMDNERTVMRLKTKTMGQFLRGGCPSHLPCDESSKGGNVLINISSLCSRISYTYSL